MGLRADSNFGDDFVIGRSSSDSAPPFVIDKTNFFVGIGTTTPNWLLQIATTTASKAFFAISDSNAGANLKHWTLSSQGGNLYLATSTDAYATSSIAALAFAGATTTLNSNLSVNGIILAEGGQRVCTSGNSVCTSAGGAVTVNTGIANRLAFYSAAGTIDSMNFLATDVTNNRFGVATATPFGKLHVSASTTPNLVLSDTGAGVDLKHWYASSTGGALVFGTLTDNLVTLAEKIRFTTTGFLGVGSSTPSSALSVNGNAYVDANDIRLGSSTATALNIFYNHAATNTIRDNVPYAWTFATSTTASPILSIETVSGKKATSSWTGGFQIDGGAFNYDYTSGEVSIDALNLGPQAFDTDAGMVSWIDMNIATGTAGILMSYSAQLDSLPILTVFGRTASGTVTDMAVGVGTTTPAWTLQVASTSAYFALSDTDAAANNKHWVWRSTGGDLYLATSSDAYATSTTPRLSFLSNGNVGIGTSTPNANLSIQGTCVDTGAGCADVAEYYHSTEAVEPGDIVAPDSETPGSVRKAMVGRGAMGIVSTNPAIAIEGSILDLMTGISYRNDPLRPGVALAGRVPVKISTEGGPIAVGDKIALSAIPGIGMKATTSGITVGIALENFDETAATTTKTLPNGETVIAGKIMVFVNLAGSNFDADKVSRLAYDAMTASTTGILPTWAVNPTTGVLRDGYYSDMKNADIANVRGIFSASGKWSLDEEGMLTVSKIVARDIVTDTLTVNDAITVGSTEKPAGITIYDQASGDPYCVGLFNSEWVKSAGECSSASLVDGTVSGATTGGGSSTPPPLAPAPAPSPEPAPTPEPSPEPTSSSTPPPADEPAPETPPTSDPAPEPAPTPEPAPAPEQTPVPSSEPTPPPEPAPSSEPEPITEPASEPTPEQTPAPEPPPAPVSEPASTP
ncbi:MAG: hypothetical protein A3C16_00430 [Candidatus Sungbacteria bacterium RIFCSPHIGHO2_02_FULL_51_29]|uniref:Uncharacterized protein n=1 Tax=Candidatus Sungbacteria bacterium RIFCSPHIGHO2_02_FULL_51_29 TaxID=1802273 RepID=A0A1G2KVR4_9BACT|nr:MAG: hypothetical protein A3C16_00430 [Candidatus Sungbacteria bacterium RIFCSPHIGHO2_02_FULL_51_29]